METGLLIVTVCLTAAGLVTLLGLYLHPAARESKPQACPCSDPRLCQPITDTTRKEIFAFSLVPKDEGWRGYDWSRVTTVVMVGYTDLQLVCHAHLHGARVIFIGGISTDDVLTDPTVRAAWIQKQVQVVKDNFLDGINFDYENAILGNQTNLREGYTSLVRDTRAALTAVSPYLQVSVDVAWSPDCIDQRCYDYVDLAAASDFLFVMAYDEQSQIRGPCIAGANSGYARTKSGLDRFLSLGVAADRLVLGVPWYGYNYPCTVLSQDGVCSIKPVPFRGVYCSDAAGRQINYSFTIELMKNGTNHRVDPDSMSPTFNFKDEETGVDHQVWYDDPKSLGLKYELAVDLGLRGVGMWNAECVDYNSQSPEQIAAVRAMWQAFPDYKRPG